MQTICELWELRRLTSRNFLYIFYFPINTIKKKHFLHQVNVPLNYTTQLEPIEL